MLTDQIDAMTGRAMGDRGNAADQNLPSTPSEHQAFVIGRAESQIGYFHRKAGRERAKYYGVKIAQIVLAAAVPVAASVHAPVPLTGSLGALIVVLEGIQQLCQWHANWIRYRSTNQSLRRELFRCRARVGDYATVPDPVNLLAERMDAIASTEVAGWFTTFSPEPGKTEAGR